MSLFPSAIAWSCLNSWDDCMAHRNRVLWGQLQRTVLWRGHPGCRWCRSIPGMGWWWSPSPWSRSCCSPADPESCPPTAQTASTPPLYPDTNSPFDPGLLAHNKAKSKPSPRSLQVSCQRGIEASWAHGDPLGCLGRVLGELQSVSAIPMCRTVSGVHERDGDCCGVGRSAHALWCDRRGRHCGGYRLGCGCSRGCWCWLPCCPCIRCWLGGPRAHQTTGGSTCWANTGRPGLCQSSDVTAPIHGCSSCGCASSRLDLSGWSAQAEQQQPSSYEPGAPPSSHRPATMSQNIRQPTCRHCAWDKGSVPADGVCQILPRHTFVLHPYL